MIPMVRCLVLRAWLGGMSKTMNKRAKINIAEYNFINGSHAEESKESNWREILHSVQDDWLLIITLRPSTFTLFLAIRSMAFGKI